MNIKLGGFLAAALLAAPIAANAQVVYDFTGVVYNATGLNLPPIGSQVSGTYTFDLANGNPAQSIGTVGSSKWVVNTYGGPFSSTSVPVPTSLVFAATIQDVLNNSYATPTPTSTFGYYYSGATGVGTFFSAGDNWKISQYVTGYTGFEINNPHGAYSADGLPIMAGATFAQGVFIESSDQSSYAVNFNITSLTRAPELDSASAAASLTLFLSLLTMAMGARRPHRP